MFTIIVAYSLVGWIPMARLVRGQVVALKEQEFISAAEAMGASVWLTEGSYDNIKITTATDMLTADAVIRTRRPLR